jgi:hypothetical protein
VVTRQPVAGAEARPVRLIPRWYTATVVAFLSVLTLGAVGLGLFSSGPMVPSAWSFALATGAGLVAAISALARPRRRREPQVLPDGTRVLVGPLLTVVALLVAWAAVTVTAGLWAYVALTDFDAIEAPGATLLTVVGAVGMLPDLVRLLTGRLHRWRLEIGPETVRYRGYRTDVTYRRRDVRGGLVHPRHPAGVEIDLRGGASKGAVIPATAFDVPAEQVIEELRRR